MSKNASTETIPSSAEVVRISNGASEAFLHLQAIKNGTESAQPNVVYALEEVAGQKLSGFKRAK